MAKNSEHSLSAAKDDLLSILLLTLTPIIYDGIVSIYLKAIEEQKRKGTYLYISQFQLFLKDIRNWNQTIIKDETERIKEILLKKHDYILRSIITMLVVLQFRILSAIRSKGPKEDVSIDAPKEEEFIHKVYTLVAKNIFESRELLQSVSNYKDAAIRQKLYNLIKTAIDDSLKSYVPINTILHVYLGDMFTESNKGKYTDKNGKYSNMDDSDSDSDSEQGQESDQKEIIGDNRYGTWPESEQIGGEIGGVGGSINDPEKIQSSEFNDVFSGSLNESIKGESGNSILEKELGLLNSEPGIINDFESDNFLNNFGSIKEETDNLLKKLDKHSEPYSEHIKEHQESEQNQTPVEIPTENHEPIKEQIQEPNFDFDQDKLQQQQQLDTPLEHEPVDSDMNIFNFSSDNNNDNEYF